jgi:hypothetical protein
MLDAVLGLANDHASVAVCGVISTLPPPPGQSSEATGSDAAQMSADSASTVGDDLLTLHRRLVMTSVNSVGKQQ